MSSQCKCKADRKSGYDGINRIFAASDHDATLAGDIIVLGILLLLIIFTVTSLIILVNLVTSNRFLLPLGLILGERALKKVKLDSETEAEFWTYLETTSQDERNMMQFLHTLHVESMLMAFVPELDGELAALHAGVPEDCVLAFQIAKTTLKLTRFSRRHGTKRKRPSTLDTDHEDEQEEPDVDKNNEEGSINDDEELPGEEGGQANNTE
ncbi:hypothetical protein B0H12DRAFT_1074362 [Mycena haematopus]|nr:hypothetical protein B0H12DRAFT_1074362 [Mycena haematopus]